MRRRDLLLFASASLVHVACGGTTTESPDGGTVSPDGGPLDGGLPDSGTPEPLPQTSAAADSHKRFPQGVVSGDPRADRLVLWTRVEPTTAEASSDITVGFVIAKDEALTTVVARGSATATADADHTLRLLPTGLEAGKTYYYRFHVTTASGSVTTQVGRARTAPAADSTAPVMFAFAACQDYIGRYYHSWQMLLDKDLDLNFVLWLGDYIYESVNDPRFQSSAGERAVKLPDGMDVSDKADGSRTVAKTLADYRMLYKTIRSDERLREVHRRYTFVTLWDDHEFADDCWQDHSTYYNEKAPNGSATTEQNTPRRMAGSRAWFEYQPADISYQSNAAFPGDITIYRSFKYGKLVDIFVTDQRMFRDDHLIPEGPSNFSVGKLMKNTSIGSRYFVTKNGFDSAEAGAPQRSMLGATQKAWFLDAVTKSTAKWKLWANEVQLWQQVLDLSQISTMTSLLKTKFYANVDQWDGFRTERKEILGALKTAGVSNLVVCTGDIHAFFASEIHVDFDAPSPTPFAVEYVTAAISSSSLKELTANQLASYSYLAPVVNPVVDNADATLMASNAHLRYSGTNAHGLAVMTISEAAVDVSYILLAGAVTDAAYGGIGGEQAFRTLDGTAKIQVL